MDLNKKDFKEKDSKVKVVAKSKSACGVEYEGTVATHGKKDAGEFTVTLPVDSKCKVKIGANKDGAGSTEAEVQASDAAKVTMKYEKTTKGSAVSGGIEFVDKQFSVETKFKLTDTENNKLATAAKTDKETAVFHKATGTNGVSVGFAAPVPGVEGAVLGLNPSYGYLFKAPEEKGKAFEAPKSFVACPISVGYSAKDFQLAFTANPVYAPLTKDTDGFQYALGEKSSVSLAGMGAKGMFKVSDAVNVAFEADQTYFGLGKDSFAAFQYARTTKKDDNFSVMGQHSLKLGAEYKMSSSTTMKAKVTYTGPKKWGPEDTSVEAAAQTFDFSLKTALGEGKSSLAVGVQMAPNKPVATGFVYTLE